jgi:hypothetical protein
MVEPGPAFGRLVTSLGARRMMPLCARDDAGNDESFPSATDSFTSFDGEDLGFSNAAAAVLIDRDE